MIMVIITLLINASKNVHDVDFEQIWYKISSYSYKSCFLSLGAVFFQHPKQALGRKKRIILRELCFFSRVEINSHDLVD